METLRVIFSFPHALGGAGIGNTALHQVRGIADAGHRVTVIARSGNRRELGRNVRLVTTAGLGPFRLPTAVVNYERQLRWHDSIAALLVRLLAGRADIVHVWPSACLRTLRAATAVGLPTVREAPNTETRHALAVVAAERAQLGLQVSTSASRNTQAWAATERDECRLADAVLAPSQQVVDSFQRPDLPGVHLVRHQYGYDPLVFPPLAADRAQTSRGAADHQTTFVFLGRGEPRKGLHLALRAWSAAGVGDRARLLVAGSIDDDYLALLRPLLRQPGVEVLGFSNPATVLAEADALVLPTLEEGSALVTYEAQAMGCALLVSTASGAVVDDGVHGLVHAVGDEATLAEHLRRLTDDPGLRRRLQRAARSHSSELTWTAATVELLGAYRQVVLGAAAAAEGPGLEAPPPVTAVICTRDRPDQLRLALTSLKQNAPGLPVLVVDSASRGRGTRDAAHDAGVNYVRCERPGLSRARNAAVAAVATEVLLFTDDDCLVAPGWADRLSQPFTDLRVGAVTGLMADPTDPATTAELSARRRYTTTVRGLDAGHGACMGFRTSALKEIGGFDPLLGAGSAFPGAEDLDAFCRLLSNGWIIVHDSGAKVLHAHGRTDDDLVPLLHGYGLGVGAMAVKLARWRPEVGGLVLARVLVRAVLSVARAVAAGRPAAQHLAGLRGTVVGALSATAAPLAGAVFREGRGAPAGE